MTVKLTDTIFTGRIWLSGCTKMQSILAQVCESKGNPYLSNGILLIDFYMDWGAGDSITNISFYCAAILEMAHFLQTSILNVFSKPVLCIFSAVNDKNFVWQWIDHLVRSAPGIERLSTYWEVDGSSFDGACHITLWELLGTVLVSKSQSIIILERSPTLYWKNTCPVKFDFIISSVHLTTV